MDGLFYCIGSSYSNSPLSTKSWPGAGSLLPSIKLLHICSIAQVLVLVYIVLIMKKYLSAGLAAMLASRAIAGDDKWLSPEYKEIFQNPLPFPPDKPVT